MAEVAALEAKSAELEVKFNENELLVEEKRQQRDERLGSLKELFGHLTGAAGDLRSRFQNSITTSQFPDREKFLADLIKKMNSDTDLPTLGGNRTRLVRDASRDDRIRSRCEVHHPSWH